MRLYTKNTDLGEDFIGIQNCKGNIIIFQSICIFWLIHAYRLIPWAKPTFALLSGEMIQTAQVHHGQKLVLVLKYSQFENLIMSIDM